MKLMDTPRYRAAINALADAIADMLVKDIADSIGWHEANDDLDKATA